MSVKDLISAIASGSAIDTQTTFNQVMAEKISAKLDDMRIDVAQNMFAIEEEAELNLEDYSVEEIEDFEQLDELSKKTLSSYADKAEKKAETHYSKAMNAAYKNRPDAESDARALKNMKISNKREAGANLARAKLAN